MRKTLIAIIVVLMWLLLKQVNANLELQITIAEQQKQLLETQIQLLQEQLEQNAHYEEQKSEPTEITLAVGKASWYGESPDECVGCRADLLMKNGERYNENALTVALPQSTQLAINSWVRIYNAVTQKEVYARFTDTGGFESLGRVADLSKATKEALGCTDLCDVEIYVPMEQN